MNRGPVPSAIPSSPETRRTLHASYMGYAAQAIANNFAPLLFITFESTLGIDLNELATLISVLFGTQLIMDLIASRYAERIGYRICILFAPPCAPWDSADSAWCPCSSPPMPCRR